MQTDSMDRILTVLNRVKFRNWTFHLREIANEVYVLQVMFDAPCNDTGLMKAHCGRNWIINSDASEDSIVKTAWMAVEIAMRHELMEQFKYNGVAIFDPHAHVSDLHYLHNLT